MKIFKALLMAGAIFTLPAVAEARMLGLLVGVADYNEPSGIHDLLGPRNDVSILWRALKARGADPADLTVLTDGLPVGPDFPVAKGLAQSADILAALDKLAGEAKSGDTVIFYYSGHGTRQPVNPADTQDEPEADGMDQVLLPSDVGAYDPIKMTLKNAIVDNVLGRKIDAIRATGAAVWAVIDACHSGTVTRGDQVTRSVDPATLGIPDAAPVQASRGGERKGTLKAKAVPGDGPLIGFYAVESYDEAIERPFPAYKLPMVGDEPKKQRMGVFTYLLDRALSRNDAATYRDLAQEIVAELNADSTGGKVPPPVFDGDLDQPVPGSDGARLPNSATGVAVDGGFTFPVGALQGFDIGAGLALYAPGQFDKPIGSAEVSAATAVTSTSRNIKWNDGVNPITQGTAAAVVTEPAINFRFMVSPPPPEDMAAEQINKAITAAFAEGGTALGIEMGTPGNPDADLLLRVKDKRLWIVRPDRPWVTTAGAYNETPSLALDTYPETLSAELKTAVWSLARATKLLRVANALGAGAGADDGIVTKATISHIPGQDAKGACQGSEPPPQAQASPLAPLLPSVAGNCDFVDIEVSNESDQDYYLAGFYVDALGGVSALPRKSANTGCVRPLPAGTGKTLAFKFWIDTWDEKASKPSSTGAENFVLLAVPKDATHQAPKLCALTQPTLTAMQQTRGIEEQSTRGKGNRLSALLGAVEGGATRGVSAAPEDDGPAMSGRLFVFDVKP